MDPSNTRVVRSVRYVSVDEHVQYQPGKPREQTHGGVGAFHEFKRALHRSALATRERAQRNGAMVRVATQHCRWGTATLTVCVWGGGVHRGTAEGTTAAEDKPAARV